MQSLETINANRQKRLRSGMLITSIAVGYTLLTSVLVPVFILCVIFDLPTGEWLLYFCPFNVMYVFLLSVSPVLLVTILPLAILPVVGCALLATGKKIGAKLIRVPQIIQIVMYAIITPLHVFIGAGMWSMAYIREALLLGIASLALPIITLCGLHRWTDNIRFE